MSQLFDRLNTNGLWPWFQSAYLASHSTETALLGVLTDLLTASDDGQVSLLTLLDLSAAFDTIDHDILLHRLEHVFGIQNSALSFLRSYLTERKQTVPISGYSSNSSTLLHGLPQGSVLGPILFLLSISVSDRMVYCTLGVTLSVSERMVYSTPCVTMFQTGWYSKSWCDCVCFRQAGVQYTWCDHICFRQDGMQ